MAPKVLGQASPAATTATVLYTVPAGKSTVCSTLTVCSLNASSATYRVAIRPAGAALANKHYIAYDILLTPASSDLWTIGLTLAETDVVTVYSSIADISFGLFGDEV